MEAGRPRRRPAGAHVLSPGGELCRSWRSGSRRPAEGAEGRRRPCPPRGSATPPGLRLAEHVGEPPRGFSLLGLLPSSGPNKVLWEVLQRESQTCDLGQEQDLAQIKLVALRDLKKGGRIARTTDLGR